MAWMALFGMAVVLAGAWRYGTDTRDGLDWQPWRNGDAIGPDRHF